MKKQIVFDIEARNGLKRGVDILAKAVSTSLGPKGRYTVISSSFGPPSTTKDGVTIAKAIELEDPLENMGAQMVKEVASKTNDLAGDGTTTATVLAQAIVKEGLKNVTAGSNPMDLKRGIDKAVEAIVADLAKQAIVIGEDVDKIKQIATISANNDEVIGELISSAFARVGKEGVITVEEAKGIDTYIDVVEGMQFDRGYLSPYFANNPEKMTTEYDNPYILLYDKKIANLKQILPIFEQVVQAGRSFVIITDDIDSETLNALVLNKLRGGIKVVVVKAPAFGERKKEILQDIAILTGATVVSEELGDQLENTTIEMLGQCSKIVVSKDDTILVGGSGSEEAIKSRVQAIKGQMEITSSEYDREKMQERLAKLTGGVAVLYVGAVSELEMKEKKERIDDALHATKAAIEEGVVVGGGVALLRATDALEGLQFEAGSDEGVGIRIVMKACEAPIRTICENAGVEGSVIIAKILDGIDPADPTFGYDAKRDKFVNMIDAGIIDPKMVTRIALENAASVAGMILTTECALINIESSATGLSQNVMSQMM